MMRREFIYLGWYLLLCIPIIILYIRFSLRSRRERLTLTGDLGPEPTSEEEKREYIRIDSVFPIEFQKIVESGEAEAPFRQGVTRDLSKDGMRIETVTVRGRDLAELSPDKTKLRMVINLPHDTHAVIATATVKWMHKVEESAVDRHIIGISYEDMAESDMERIIKYALWLRRKPDMFALVVVALIVAVAAFFSTILFFKGAKEEFANEIRFRESEKQRLVENIGIIENEKAEAVGRLESITTRYANLRERVKALDEKNRQAGLAQEEKAAASITSMEEKPQVIEEEIEEEIREEVGEDLASEEVTGIKEIESEPIVMLRKTDLTEEDAESGLKITRDMIASEANVYKAFRNYILEEEIQRLDRYSSTHRTSIYHAASLFALGELRYKKRHIKEMIIKVYRDVIKLYPRSKYASYASHRLDQIERNLPYNAYSLRYYSLEYNLPTMYDYRELEPYKE
ncbi:MAG: PilZ domain-containing protein [Candidatus Omnitrophica bacterium]|nr:PilZ domain-containing protein [Candidatus Omnitrophota bacterium]